MRKAEWRALIADDEPAARRGVGQLLAAFPDFIVVGECRNGAEVLTTLDVSKPDVIFLDIQMPGIDGFEVIRRRTPEKMPAVVFLTAFDQFAVQAFESEALDYLVKPVSEARFAATMKRLIRRFRTTTPSIREESIVVTTSRGARVLDIREIDWIESADNYVFLWIGKQSYLIPESMQQLEGRVRSHGFVRAHRRALVRLDGVRALSESANNTLVAILECGTRIPVSRRRRTAFASAVRRLGGLG